MTAPAQELAEGLKMETNMEDSRQKYMIRGRRVGAIGIMEDIVVLYANDSQHALQRAARLYEAGWEHLQPFPYYGSREAE